MAAFYSVYIGITVTMVKIEGSPGPNGPGEQQQNYKQEHKGTSAKLTVAAVEFCHISLFKPTAVKQSCHVIKQTHIVMYMSSDQPQQSC